MEQLINENSIERYIYIWSVRWSMFLSPFIKKFNDKKTKFIFTGNYFWCWGYSYEIIQEIYSLHKEWLFEWVLWQEDVYFMIGLWAHPDAKRSSIASFSKLQLTQLEYSDLWKNNYALFINMGYWRNTLKSFGNWFKYNIDAEIERIVDFFHFNLSIFCLDSLWNIVVSWGLPILNTWEPIKEVCFLDYDNQIKWSISWMKYMIKQNRELLEMNIDFIKKLTFYRNKDLLNLIWDLKDIWDDTKPYDLISKKFETYNPLLLPTSYDNSRYVRNDIVLEWLKKELLAYGKKRLICSWLSRNTDKDYSNLNHNNYQEKLKTEKDYTVIRLDRTNIHVEYRNEELTKCWTNSFWYCIMNKENELFEVWDAYELFPHLYDRILDL